MKNFEYYYDLEDVCSDRAAYRPKATSAGITTTGYAPNFAVASSESNAHDKDAKEAIDDTAADGVYNTPTDQSRLTNESSTTAAKKARMHSKHSSNKKVKKTAHRQVLQMPTLLM